VRSLSQVRQNMRTETPQNVYGCVAVVVAISIVSIVLIIMLFIYDDRNEDDNSNRRMVADNDSSSIGNITTTNASISENTTLSSERVPVNKGLQRYSLLIIVNKR